MSEPGLGRTKEMFTIMLREKGWAQALSDVYTERDTLRAEAERLREVLEELMAEQFGKDWRTLNNPTCKWIHELLSFVYRPHALGAEEK